MGGEDCGNMPVVAIVTLATRTMVTYNSKPRQDLQGKKNCPFQDKSE